MNYPLQEASSKKNISHVELDGFDMRDWLSPRRLTMVMWDYAFLTRHMKGDAFEDYDKVLKEALERGYNTIRIDPMPQTIDLNRPEDIICRPALAEQPLHPWDRHEAFEGPAGIWLIEFMSKLQSLDLNYCLSAWNMQPFRDGWQASSLSEIMEKWRIMLRQWKKRFGFEKCVYVDLANEFPYFLNGHMQNTIKNCGGRWTRQWNDFIKQEVATCLRALRLEFPELRFMVSLHGDVRWIDLELELDVMDIHFYSDADPRFNDRTLFDKNAGEFFINDELYKDFSDRCLKSHRSMAPMYRACQRSKLAAFSEWSIRSGVPLVTTESWASWFYCDHPDLDWSWLLEWAEWSVEDAHDFHMWGWTPHNYCQPQFRNWRDARWHRRLTERFLKS
jgi:hypothetical protein